MQVRAASRFVLTAPSWASAQDVTAGFAHRHVKMRANTENIVLDEPLGSSCS